MNPFLTILQGFPILLAELSPIAVKWLLMVWLVALGGAVGSFLNVVVYRLPTGMSLSRPGSHCPICKTPIRWRDNVPVFGWIFLRGRCRDCSTKISPRYPIVEAVTAGVFLVIGLVEGLSGGGNLPLRPVPVADGVLRSSLDLVQLSGIIAYHLLLLSTLLPAALIEYDGHRVPVRLVVPALVVGLLTPLVWPHLHPVPACWKLAGPVAGLVDGLAGLAAGLLLGMAVWRMLETNKRLGFLLALGCVGLFLGWQAVAALAVLGVAVHLPVRVFRRMRPDSGPELPTTWLAVATLGWILLWEPLVGRWPFLG